MEMSKKWLIALAGLSLTACSSMDEKNTFMTYDDLQNKVRAHEDQWQAAQVKLDKIDALEAEIAALKQEKSNTMTEGEPQENIISDDSMAAVNVIPAVTPAPINEEASDKMMADSTEESVEMANAAPPVVAAPMAVQKQEYGVQVAAYGNRQDAIRGWKVMQKKSPASFDGLTPLINEKEVSGRMMYQLKVGPFFSKSFGSDFCKMLKEKGTDCLVTQYNGETFAAN
ncbi:hypothetical protein MACH16_10370 [Marinomonas pontica]|uniref:SPOR domain-containing protein n=1 Tax=Marinomonas pontica TaxID=264739 RepID=A0ABM8FB25_9GAMM|nr:hypothetical protein MACH16_10370 [Marinomonas pontica]